MRRLAYAFLSTALLISACSEEQPVQPNAPQAVDDRANVIASPADSARIAELIEGSQTLIQGLFGTWPSCTGNCNAAMAKFDQIAELYTSPPPYNMESVVSHTYDLINFILAKYDAGILNDPPGADGVTELVNLLYQYAGIDATLCDIGADCDLGFYQPGSPAFTLIAPSGWASLEAPPGTGTVTLPTVLSLFRLTPDNDLSTLYLETQLDQYPLQYEFNSSSGEEFLQNVKLTVCLADDVFPPSLSRLSLAHNVAEPAPFENIQILPTGGAGTLNCNGAATTDQVLQTSARPSVLRDFAMRGLRALAGALSPDPLQAAMVAGTGITGTSKNLSPFGIVDYLGLITANSATSIPALENSAVEAPSVRLVTPTEYAANNPSGPGMAGIPVTFTITAGNGCFDSPCGPSSPTTVVANTDASGYASAPAWTIGSGANTATASAAIPCSAPVATGTVANCGTIQTTGGGSSLTFSATGLPAVSNILPASLPAGVEGVAYPGASFTASGGDGSYSWAVTGGTLPTGLALSSGGSLSGTPTAGGNFSFTVTVTSGPLSAAQNYSVTIYAAPSVTGPATLGVGIQGGAYPSTTFTASGGDGTYSWAISAGALPAGLTLSSGGTLSGTPTVNGNFNFTVRVTTGPTTSPATATRNYSLSILAPVSITTATPLPGAVIGVPYGPQTLQATGGTGSFSWSLASGSLPAGISLSGATLSGTPTANGTSNFGITATSVGGPGSATKAFSLTVGYPTAILVSFQSQPSGTACYAVNQIISPPITVKVTTTGGAPLAGVPVNIVAILNNGSTVVVSQPSATTAANGIATFNTLSINKAGAYQLKIGTSSPWPVTTLLGTKFKISPKCS